MPFDKLQGGRRTLVLPRHYTVAQALIDGATPKEALLKAGYSEVVANQGKAKLCKAVYAAYHEITGRELKTVGEILTRDPQTMEHIVVGSLYKSMVERNSRGVNAAKALAHHVGIADKFTPEQQNNVVVIQAPADWKPEARKYRDWDSLPDVAEQKLPDYE